MDSHDLMARATAQEYGLDPDTELGRLFTSLVARNARERTMDLTMVPPAIAQTVLDGYRNELRRYEGIFEECPHPSLKYLCQQLRETIQRMVEAWGETPDPEVHNFTCIPEVLETLITDQVTQTKPTKIGEVSHG